MIKISRLEVSGLANALYGMRLPKGSNDRADSKCLVYNSSNGIYTKHINDITSNDIILDVKIGNNDKKLAFELILTGTDHGKWLRQVGISILIKAPMSFWWDFDTYKVATVKNSSSRMHKIASRQLTVNDFSWDDENGMVILSPFREHTLQHLNEYIEEFNNTNTDENRKKELFRLIIQDIPDSYNFTALWTGSAQTARNYYFARRNHKQKELRELANYFANIKNIGDFIALK